jgi:starch phosphorylase
MVHDYTIDAYRPALERRALLERDGFKRARGLAQWRSKLLETWSKVRIVRVEAESTGESRVGDSITVKAWIELGELSPGDVAVQLCSGRVDENEELSSIEVLPMDARGSPGGDDVSFSGRIVWNASGRRGFTVRVLPRHEDLAHPHETGLALWAS